MQAAFNPIGFLISTTAKVGKSLLQGQNPEDAPIKYPNHPSIEIPQREDCDSTPFSNEEFNDLHEITDAPLDAATSRHDQLINSSSGPALGSLSIALAL